MHSQREDVRVFVDFMCISLRFTPAQQALGGQ